MGLLTTFIISFIIGYLLGQIANTIKHGRSLTKLEKADVDFKTSIRDIKKSAERQWIEVLTPEQYKRLPSSAIEPNKIYMCIKYNKPYAMYVGSVLIAQRDSKSSTGFAYTFPLTF